MDAHRDRIRRAIRTAIIRVHVAAVRQFRHGGPFTLEDEDMRYGEFSGSVEALVKRANEAHAAGDRVTWHNTGRDHAEIRTAGLALGVEIIDLDPAHTEAILVVPRP